ncbi:hypothetical protein MAPG_03533 [Magnaporthiopsis poae ATCC 64411]|uniref:Paraoxonase n=1 Tax=Magnaporthiopsis poae (strain ATCC 64411 / 73-15) TaxID=644358 RepID=A0A0C4DU96_MAGP6|nr:hypothetical protein MAPG_03533 [Magnaporthiopsis poae ATCC 64411]
MAGRASIIAILLGLLLQYIVWTRWPALSTIINHGPPYSGLPSAAAFGSSSVRLKDKVRNCEDVVLLEHTHAAILSCDRGRDGWNTVMGAFAKKRDLVPNGDLLLYRYDEPSEGDALKKIQLVGYGGGKDGLEADFHPLGIEYHALSGGLFVVNHHRRGSRLEIFRLGLEADPPVARYLRTITHPLVYSPNSIAAVTKNELYVTNDHFFPVGAYPWLSFLETYLAPPLAGVTYLKLDDLALESNSQAEPVLEAQTAARLPFANGAVLLNTTTLAVASTSNLAIYLYEIDPRLGADSSSARGKLLLLRKIPVPFFPDNISVDKRGVLLIAGHPHPGSLNKVKEARRVCMDALHGSGEAEAADCNRVKKSAPSWVSEWTEEAGLRHIYVAHAGFGSSSTAVRDVDKGMGIITGLYEEGVLVWKEDEGLAAW